MPKAHSFMIDLNRSFLNDDIRFAQWIGEFYPAYDMASFIEAVWAAAKWKVEEMVEKQMLRPATWPPANSELLKKHKFHCSLPLSDGSNIVAYRWDGAAHCRSLSGGVPDGPMHVFMPQSMDEHFRRCLGVVRAGENISHSS